MSIIKNVIHKLEKISKKAIFGSIEAYRIYYRKKLEKFRIKKY